VVLGALAQVADGVRAADRIGLAEQVVGERDRAVGVRAGKLGQRGAGAGAHLALLDAQHRRQLRIALSPLEQQLEHRGLVGRQGHGDREA
jgi:hypothetical protein